MSANLVIDRAVGLDIRSPQLVPYFDMGESGNEFAGPFWTCERIDYAVGPEPSAATCKIPLASQQDERAPTIAAVRGGPLDAIKIGTSAVIRATNADGESADCFRGHVTRISHEFGPLQDCALIQISDARWLLGGVPIVGSMWMQGSAPVYRPGWGIIPNYHGEPNAVFCEAAECFVFCEPRYGLYGTQQPPLPTDYSTSQACYWEPWMLIQHMRYLVMNSTRSLYPEAGRLPASIQWPEMSHAGLAAFSGVRCRQEIYQGQNLARALHNLAEQAGGYALAIEFGAGGQPCIAFIPTRYTETESGNWPISIIRPESGGDLSLADAAMQASIEEDGTQLYTRATLAGSQVTVERRASSLSGFVPAWADTDQANFKSAVHAALTSGLSVEDALRRASASYPSVFTTWRIDPAWNYAYGITPLASYTPTQTARPILDALITTYEESGNGSSQSRMPITFEYQPDGETTWLIMPTSDLAVDARGLIRCNAMRDFTYLHELYVDAPAFRMKLSGNITSGISSLTGNTIRATVAIPMDHQVTQTVGHPADENTDVPPIPDADADRIAVHTGRHVFLAASPDDGSADGHFRQDWRYDSYPIPEAALGSSTGNASQAYRNDSSTMLASIERRAQKLMRLRRAGQIVIPRLSTTWRLGMMIAGIEYDGGSWPIRSALTRIAWVNTNAKQYTILGFGS